MPGKVKVQPRSLLIDHREVCHLLGVKVETWLKRVERGQVPLPHSRMGRLLYYKRSDIRSYLKTGLWPAMMKFRQS